MKAFLRGFLTGFGFTLGASIAGTLIGYGIGKIGESSLKRLLSPEHADQDQDGEPEWHKGCTWCWRTTWHQGDGPTGNADEDLRTAEGYSCGHCDFRSPFRVQVMQHAAEAHSDDYVVEEWVHPEDITAERCACGEHPTVSHKRTPKCSQHKSHYGASSGDAKAGWQPDGFIAYVDENGVLQKYRPTPKLCLITDEAHKAHDWTDQNGNLYRCGGVAEEGDGGDYDKALDRHDNG